jgi:hypothetical protein
VWPLAIFALVAVVFGVIGYVNWKREQARRALLMQWATGNGWQLTVRDDSWCDRWNGAPFGEGDHRRASNVIVGTWQGHQFAAFDYSYETHSSTGKGGETTTTYRYAVTAVTVPAYLPRLQVTPESMLERLGHAFGVADIDLESEDFNRAFRVTCPDAKFASDALPPRTMQMLLAHRGLCWRFEGTDLVAWHTGEHSPAEILEALTATTGILAGIPSFVWHDHGYDAGSPALGGTPWSSGF